MRFVFSIGAVVLSAIAIAYLPARTYGETIGGLRLAVRVVQTDVHHPGTLLAGTASAQLFRSRDRGQNWTALTFPTALRSTLHAILVHPERPDIYFVAVSSEDPESAGLFRSSDQGATWRQELRRKQVWALASWPGDADVIAAGTAEGIFLSSNGGETWRRLGPVDSISPRPVMSLAFDPEDSNILYAGTPHLAWKTSDGGASWRRLSKGMQADSDIFSIDVDPTRRSRLFAGACSGMYSSLDGGGTWSTLEQVIGGAYRTYTVARPPGRSSVIFAGTSSGLMRTADGGATWEKLTAEAARSIAFDPEDPQVFFVATDGGVLISTAFGNSLRGPFLEHEIP